MRISKLNDRLFLRLVAVFGCMPLLAACSAAGAGASYRPPEFPGEITAADGQWTILPAASAEYITNPGAGWQHRPEESAISDFPETVVYSDRRLIAWKYLNPAEGVYDWAPLNAQLAGAVEDGKQFSFRVYTMVGEGYDGHMTPDWAVGKGVLILESGEPDYSNCVYQEEWGRFVQAMISEYDGDPDVAFIDISGYGNFNEWDWRDTQTEWDETWADSYSQGTASPEDFLTLDGQARKRLADMFIGGESDSHQCRNPDGTVETVSYHYAGFQNTQLVMPYAGIAQSTEYVFSRRRDVGFRHDCLGRNSRQLTEKVGAEILNIWKTAPVVFELCKPDAMTLEEMQFLARFAHASLVHNNEWEFSYEELEDLMTPVGYRYFLKKAVVGITEGQMRLDLAWQNLGYAPNYPKMGQDFQLTAYLLNEYGEPAMYLPLNAEIASWFPAASKDEQPAEYLVSESLQIPPYVAPGKYLLGVAILDARRQIPISLAFGGRDPRGIHVLTWVDIP